MGGGEVGVRGGEARGWRHKSDATGIRSSFFFSVSRGVPKTTKYSKGSSYSWNSTELALNVLEYPTRVPSLWKCEFSLLNYENAWLNRLLGLDGEEKFSFSNVE